MQRSKRATAWVTVYLMGLVMAFSVIRLPGKIHAEAAQKTFSLEKEQYETAEDIVLIGALSDTQEQYRAGNLQITVYTPGGELSLAEGEDYELLADSNRIRIFKKLFSSDGTYSVIASCKGYETFVGHVHYYQNLNQPVAIRIQAKDASTPKSVSGAVFNIKSDPEAPVSGAPVVDYTWTAQGQAESVQLYVGRSYILTEIRPADGYETIQPLKIHISSLKHVEIQGDSEHQYRVNGLNLDLLLHRKSARITYAFTSATPGSVLPDVVNQSALPNDADARYGDTVKPEAPRQKTVKVSGGTWHFVKWDALTKTVQSDCVTFTGSWKFEKEIKPTQSKPTQPKPTQSKPTQSKPTQSKPTQSKPTQSKPTQSKPAQPKPTQSKPTQSKPTQSKPAESKAGQFRLAVFRAGFQKFYRTGETVGLAARAEGGKAPYRYQFFVLRSNGARVNLTSLRAVNTFDWRPENPDKGYRVGVDVVDAGGARLTRMTTVKVVKSADTSKPSGSFRVVVLRAGAKSQYKAGEIIRLAARAEGGKAPYRYQFFVLRSNGARVNLTSLRAVNTFDWRPVTPDSGYRIGVDVVDAAGCKVSQTLAVKVVK